jgi:chorismate--pyruvate lyase
VIPRLEPHWHPLRNAVREVSEANVREWLAEPGSLTQLLVGLCGAEFRVDVRRQGRDYPTPSEARALGLRGRRFCLVREVHLLCGRHPWVFARTVMPYGTLTGRQRRLGRLGTRPLGALLFADPAMEREPPEVGALQPGTSLFHHAVGGLQAERPVWGRRSVYYLGGKPLLVSEFFLPGIPPRDPFRRGNAG